MELQILVSQTVVAGKFKDQYMVVDSDKNLVGKKAHSSQAEAEAERDSLKFYAEGMAFAKATAPEGAQSKTLVGKANQVAQYLLWKEQGGQEAAAVDEAVEEAVETAAETVEESVAEDGEEF